jgi:hypothetical protein
MQRVRIGLTGLASVFILVLLAAAFFGLVNEEGAIHTDNTGNVVVDSPANAASDAAAPKDPLAELGVTPGNAPEPPAKAATTQPR